MHKLECSAMNLFGEKWCPSEITRLVARMLTKKVRERPQTCCDYSGTLSELRLFKAAVSHRKGRRTDVFRRSCCSSGRCSHVSSCFCEQAHGAGNCYLTAEANGRYSGETPSTCRHGGHGQWENGDAGGRCCRTPSVFLQTSGDSRPQRSCHALFAGAAHTLTQSDQSNKSDVCYLFYSIGCVQRFHYRRRWALPPGHCSLPRVRKKPWYGLIWNASKDGNAASVCLLHFLVSFQHHNWVRGLE